MEVAKLRTTPAASSLSNVPSRPGAPPAEALGAALGEAESTGRRPQALAKESLLGDVRYLKKAHRSLFRLLLTRWARPLITPY